MELSNSYAVILADPPWKYRVYDDSDARHGAAAAHYPTMTAREIAALPVARLAHPNAALFLWATMPCLQEALEVMRAWGFTYKTVAFTWVKLTRGGALYLGLGHYTRGNAELCLLGIRGRMRRKSARVSQIIIAPRREHSRKPEEQYERIMQLFDGPYLELFARRRWPGWDAWGLDLDPACADRLVSDTPDLYGEDARAVREQLVRLRSPEQRERAAKRREFFAGVAKAGLDL
ncbi:MAG: MT-A70 family methyltransferase [Moorellales bacterium]